MKNFYKGLLLFLVSLQVLQGPLYAETGTGIIKGIKPLGNGTFEITLDIAGKNAAYVVNDATEIQSQTSAEKLRPGTRIYVPGPKGVKSGLGDLSPLVKKELGLPNVPKIPQLPEMPDLPSKTAMEKLPQSPVKKTNGKSEAAPAGEASAAMPPGMAGGEAQQKKTEPKEEEPKEHEKKLFGPVDADKSLVPNKGETDEALVESRVVNVEKTSGGIKLKFESGEETIVAPAKKIVQRLSPTDLQEQMKVQIELPGSGNAVKKVTVIS